MQQLGFPHSLIETLNRLKSYIQMNDMIHSHNMLANV